MCNVSLSLYNLELHRSRPSCPEEERKTKEVFWESLYLAMANCRSGKELDGHIADFFLGLHDSPIDN
jgi:hypothetical protein